jgi:hypothetical protein
MKNLTTSLFILATTAFYCYSQSSYPKLIQHKADSVMAFWPIQAKELLKAVYERDHLRKMVTYKDSIITIKTIYIAKLEQANKDFNSVVDGYNALAAIRDEQIEIKIEYAKHLEKQLRRTKRRAIWLPIATGIGGALIGYGFGKL